ncbi:hypothetical protein AgCh_002786 [Apium graveolens]
MSIAKHYETGETLPKDIYLKFLAARTYRAGSLSLRQHEYWGLGIATAAVKMALAMVFEKFSCLVRIEALVEEENRGSQRVLEKVGFKKEGLLSKYGYNKGEIGDRIMYSLGHLQ